MVGELSANMSEIDACAEEVQQILVMGLALVVAVGPFVTVAELIVHTGSVQQKQVVYEQ